MLGSATGRFKGSTLSQGEAPRNGLKPDKVMTGFEPRKRPLQQKLRRTKTAYHNQAGSFEPRNLRKPSQIANNLKSSRGDRTPIELFTDALCHWATDLRCLLGGC